MGPRGPRNSPEIDGRSPSKRGRSGGPLTEAPAENNKPESARRGGAGRGIKKYFVDIRALNPKVNIVIPGETY